MPLSACPYCSEHFNSLANHWGGQGRCAVQHREYLTARYQADDSSEDEDADTDVDDRNNIDQNIPERQDGSDGSRSTDSELGGRGPSDVDMMSLDERGDDDLPGERSLNGDSRENTPPRIRGTERFVEHYPVPTVGTPIRQVTAEELRKRQQDHTDVGPFTDEELFELVEVVLTSGMSGRKRDRFLKLNRMNGVTPWNNNREMLADIDRFLPRGPKWRVKTYQVAGSKGVEYADFWFRDGLEGILHLLANPQFENHMEYKPTKVYADPDRKIRVYGETTSADRMWSLQNVINDNYATVVPTFLASDKTSLTVFVREQKAHPIYLMIGNLEKGVRCQISKRGMILIGYLPVLKLACEPNDEKRRVLKLKVLHECMREMTASMGEACKQGKEAICSDGGIRRIYPVFCGGLLDFAEQCRYACTRQSVCPTCDVPAKERGDLTNCHGRDREDILAAMHEEEVEGSARFEDLGLLPVSPFWADLPFVDASTLFPPDLLHQMYKGVFKDHLLEWSAHAMGKTELNDRFKAMSPHHGLRHFKDGILKSTRWTGRELKEQSRAYLPTMAGAEPEVAACARTLTEFIFLAHSSSLTDEDLEHMQTCLEVFHENKHIFPEIGALGEQDQAKKKGPVRTFHGIPKIHAMLHYPGYIKQLGTPDGFNTELPERLHIPNAKEVYRRSNKKEVVKQMAKQIQRTEAIAMHRSYLDHMENPDADDPDFDNGEQEDEEDEEEGEDDDDGVGLEGLQRLALDDEDEVEGVVEEDKGARQRVGVGANEGAVVEGDIEEEPEQEEIELERRDLDDNGTWEEPDPEIRHARKPTVRVPGSHLVDKHGTTRLIPAIKAFFRRQNLPFNDLKLSLDDKFSVWYRCRMFHSPPPFKPTEGPKVETVRAFPAIVDTHGRRRRQAQFDTALYLADLDKTGLFRYRACRVRAIFELPKDLLDFCPEKLVYTELFNTFHGPDINLDLYRTSQSFVAGQREVVVIPLSMLRMTCHLAPRYGTATEELDLDADLDILSACKKFVFNEYGSFFSYELMHHWLGIGAIQ
ncbi:hypothetical protein FRC08_010465 [Ceratobasidium sp. 394]|nr:hypothetical protein FRC08_010465 [Ceratobasidium sp. 394]